MPLLAALFRRVLRAYGTEAGRTASRNFVWLAALTVLTQICGMGAVFYLTDGLGDIHFGAFAFSLSLQAYLVLLGGGGVNRICVRDGAQHPEQVDTIESSRLAITAPLSVAIFLLMTTAVCFISMPTDERILIILLSAGNIPASINMRFLFDVHHRQPISAAISLVTELAALATIIAVNEFGRLTLPAVGAIYAVKWTVACIGQFVVYHRTIRPWRWSWSRDYVRQMLVGGWPLLWAGLFASIPMRSGIFFVRWFHGDVDTAIYGLAQQIAVAYLVFCAVATRILQPHIAGPYGMTRGFIKKLLLFFVLFHATILAAALGLSATVIEAFLKPSFQAAVLPTAILLIGRMLASAGMIGGMYAIAQMRERVVLRVNICAAVFFVIACVWWVPQGSYVACAWVALMTSAIRLILILWAVTRSDR
jgi:O-antigen/teichoic acid export membrane protein